eukprot:945983-Rhodomonas_salina.2
MSVCLSLARSLYLFVGAVEGCATVDACQSPFFAQNNGPIPRLRTKQRAKIASAHEITGPGAGGAGKI